MVSVLQRKSLKSMFTKRYFEGKSRDWWYSLDKDTKGSKWEEFEKVFTNRWINDTKMKEMHKIQVELNESKEKVSKL
jgi:hypothetical protein